MYALERICFHHWNLLIAEDIEVRGATALIGAIGSGKSSILDGIQTVISGNRKNDLRLNRAAGARSKRTVLEYCLGKTEETIANGTFRERCETVLVLAFRDQATRMPISIGLVLDADAEDAREETRARFVANGVAFRFQDHFEIDAAGDRFVPDSETLLARLKAQAKGGFATYQSGERFVEAYLTAMRRRGATPNPSNFLSRFANAVAFEEIADPTEFVRRYVLDPDPIDVERIRSSIETWRELEREVQRIETMIAEGGEVRGRYATLARQTVEHNLQAFVEHHAERLRLEREIERHAGVLAGHQEGLARAKAKLAYNEREIAAVAEEVQRKRIVLSESAEAGKLDALIEREKNARERVAAALTDLTAELRAVADLGALAAIRDNLPISTHAAVTAAQQLARLVAAAKPRALVDRMAEITDLVDQAQPLAGVVDRIEIQADAKIAEQAEKQRELEDLAERLRRAGDGAVLSTDTLRFQDELRREGIAATPLPDVVEIASGEEAWARALEMVLGPFKEALIVPEPQLGEAFDLLYRKRRAYDRCRLVNTRKTARGGRPAKEGAIVGVAVTDHPDARAFLDAQYGHILRAETAADLDRLDHAIMTNGRTAQGSGLRVYRDDFEPILGRTARTAALGTLRARQAALIGEMEALAGEIRALRAAVHRIRDARDVSAASVQELASRIVTGEAAIAGVEKDFAALETAEVKALRAEVEALEADAAAFRAENEDELKPAIEQLGQAVTDATVELRGAEEKAAATRAREDAARAAEAAEPILSLQRLIAGMDTVERAESEIRTHLEFQARGREREYLARRRNEAAQRGRDLAAQLRPSENRARNAFGRFCEAWVTGGNPLPGDAGIVEELAWILRELSRLELHELRPHRQSVEDARRQMELALKEDLLTKLHDKFEGVRTQLDTLNRRLAQHRFTGQTYFLSRQVDQSVSKLHRLAQAVADSPDRGAAIVSGGQSDPVLDDAMRQIEELIAREQDTRRLEDYRQYFTFELNMTADEVEWSAADGPTTGPDRRPPRITATLSSRTGKGSGGQRQTPYYVAIAASMAAAYYPGSRRADPDGMGLVCFDEAFSKLDIENTQALIEFFGRLSLQILVAAPEEKRTSFMELMDTIVSISKMPGGEEIYIDVENLKERARQALRDSNPDHVGIAGFRDRLAAEAGTAPQAAD